MNRTIIPASNVEFVFGQNISDAIGIPLSGITGESWVGRTRKNLLSVQVEPEDATFMEMPEVVPARDAANGIIVWRGDNGVIVEQSVEDFAFEGPITNDNGSDMTPEALSLPIYA